MLDREPYRYQQFISDIAGQDIYAHNNTPEGIVKRVRNWLRSASGRRTIPSGSLIWERYQNFIRDLPETTQRFQLTVEEMIFNDYTTVIKAWLEANTGSSSKYGSRR